MRARGRTTPITDLDRDRIARARVERGMTWEQLARRAGLTATTLHKMMNGQVRSSARLAAIYRALGLPSTTIGEPDRLEARVLSALRTLRSALPPGRVDDVIVELETLAERASALRLKRDALADEEAQLTLRMPSRDSDDEHKH